MIQNLINHVIFDIDASGSMGGQPVVKVFDAQLEYLKKRSIDMDQETRISVALFGTRGNRQVLVFDMDVMRFKTLAGHYHPGGQTALIDSILDSIKDHDKIPTQYGDHAFLHYTVTDGYENDSRHTSADLRREISILPENWTQAILVPGIQGKTQAKDLGFPSGAIEIWDTNSAQGLEDVGRRVTSTIDSYMGARTRGIRGSSTGLFTMDPAKVKVSKLQEISPRSYQLVKVTKDEAIKDLVERKVGAYVLGSAYYQPAKRVKVQDHKELLVRNVISGKLYKSPDPVDLRHMLGLPDHTVEVGPNDNPNYEIFIQSTSVNRKLIAGTSLVVLK